MKTDGSSSRFLAEMVQDLDNKFELILDLEQVQISDMGHYELRIRDIDGSIYEPTLSMVLYVNAAPQVSYRGQNPLGFYHVNQNISINRSSSPLLNCFKNWPVGG